MDTKWNPKFICWLLATLATLGSLFFSEVMNFTPCVLCWYQRIAMYPLVIIFLVGYIIEDNNVFKYSLPFIIIGLLIAIYHNLIQWGIVPETLTPCKEGLSCADKWIEWLGFVTIPLLSLIAFLLLLIIYFLSNKGTHNEK